MTAHFGAVGFEVASIEDLDRLVHAVLADTEPVERRDGGLTYVRGTSSGAAVTIHLDSAGMVTVVEPFLAPESTLPARFDRIIRHPDCVHHSVVLATTEVFHLAFVTPHLEAWAETLVPGAEIELGVGGVVEAIGMPDAESGADRWPHELVLTGLDSIPPVPTARVSGFVREHILRHNELGHAFEWACLDVGGLPIEICAAVDEVPMPFQTDMIVQANVRLTGPILASL